VFLTCVKERLSRGRDLKRVGNGMAGNEKGRGKLLLLLPKGVLNELRQRDRSGEPRSCGESSQERGSRARTVLRGQTVSGSPEDQRLENPLVTQRGYPGQEGKSEHQAIGMEIFQSTGFEWGLSNV